MVYVRSGVVGTGSVPVTPSAETVVVEVEVLVVVAVLWAWAVAIPIPHSRIASPSVVLTLFFIQVSFAARCALRGD